MALPLWRLTKVYFADCFLAKIIQDEDNLFPYTAISGTLLESEGINIVSKLLIRTSGVIGGRQFV